MFTVYTRTFNFIPAVSWIGLLGCAFNTQQFWRSCHCWRRLGRVFGDTGVWRAMCKAVGVFYNQLRLFIGWFHAPPLFMLGNWWPIIYSTKNMFIIYCTRTCVCTALQKKYILRWVELFEEEWNGVLCSWANLSCSSFFSTPGRGHVVSWQVLGSDFNQYKSFSHVGFICGSPWSTAGIWM